jgi:hypothetical protein
MPQLLAYPPPPDGSAEGQNGSVSAPSYMMPLPGVFYAYPSHPQAPGVLPLSIVHQLVLIHSKHRCWTSTHKSKPSCINSTETQTGQNGCKTLSLCITRNSSSIFSSVLIVPAPASDATKIDLVKDVSSMVLQKLVWTE